MQQKDVTSQEIDNQAIYRTEHWTVLLPERPINPYHFILILNRDDANHFTDVNSEELVGLKDLVAFLAKTFENDGTSLNGYNLFSNNGTYEIGQHLRRFHQHIFIRTQDETESPYTVMAEGRRWSDADSAEWGAWRDNLRVLFKV